ncbi:MAG: hypothetical protein AB8B57_02765 [Congregibacter sp.]
MNDCLKPARSLAVLALVFFTALEVSAAPPAIWGAKFTSIMTLNATGFVSWLKVVNPGASAESITADIIWTLADGTEGSVTGASLGSVDAGGILTVSEASILSAMSDPVQVADVFITVIIANPDAVVHSEKKASDGRLALPVERTYVLTDPSI